MTERHVAPRFVPYPVHTMLSAFPLAFFPAALVTDIAYANTANMQWANFSVWLIAAGAAIGVVAALVGIIDAIIGRNRSHRRSSSLHTILMIAALVVAIINGFIHSRDAWTSVVPTGLILSAVTTILVLVASWLGYSAAQSGSGAA